MNVLEKRLVEISEDYRSKGDEIVEDVKLLLADTAAEERSVLKSIGLDADLRVAEKKLEDQIIRSESGKKLGKTIILGNDIKKMCTEYRLYMKPAKEYIGTIPPTLGAELTRFCKEKNIVLPAGGDYSRFYIIAPPKMFKDYISPATVFTGSVKKKYSEAEERERKRREDPILIYKLDQKGYYAIIKSWGNDFSPLRRVYGFFTKAANINWISFVLNSTFFWVILFGLYKLNMFMATYHKLPDWDGSHWLFLSVPVTIISLVLLGNYMWNEDWDFRSEMRETITKYEDNAKY